ncbi:hypothetical protein RhiirA5_448079 [Rhizophagus irregularis]|uniref:Uncharacterized protein n=1 Tax=Rhizophagus irregularis TaxID=588596 RepID=A0A2N0NAS3_9GLOM|nr:hypothetical protein RhiirA5_448079 [Rhizophagus irregularis]
MNESNNLEESDKESDNCDIESEENNENNFEESNGRESDINETIEAEEENIENIPNFILYNPESNQTTVIDIRPVSVNCNTLQFPDTAYAEFMELVSTHHLSNSAGNSVLKWFCKHYLQNNEFRAPNRSAKFR